VVYARAGRGGVALGQRRTGHMSRVARVLAVVLIDLVIWLGCAFVAVGMFGGQSEAEAFFLGVVGFVLWVGGFWCAWRVGSGRWGLWRGRRGHPVAAMVIPFLSAICLNAVLWAVLAGTSLLWVRPLAIALQVAGWVGIFWLVWRAGTRRWGYPAPTPPAPPALAPTHGRKIPVRRVLAFDSTAWVPTHRVTKGGAWAWVTPAVSGGSFEWVELPAGTELRVEETSGAWTVVTGSSGRMGSVDSRRLEPLVSETAPRAIEPPPPA
jgi:hypothetical protein